MKATDHRSLLIAELDPVRSDLQEVFPRIRDEDLGWAPSLGMRTIHGQFVELIATERGVMGRILGTEAGDPKEEDAPLWAEKTVAGQISLLNETRDQTLAWIRAASEEELARTIALSEGFREYLRLTEVPASELIRFIARHESYHAGQMVSYLWARGDNPYDWE